MNLIKLLNLKKNTIVSIVGAGGKTSLMFSLADELRAENKILVSTSTKIYNPEKEQYDFLALSDDEFKKYNHSKEKGTYIYADNINPENKLEALRCEELNKHASYFDYVLIEADGSKRKSLKGWRENEPVIISRTDMTIGVLSLELIGAEINADNIHRVDKFMEITDSNEGDIIGIKHIISLIFHKNGLFKDSVGEKVLFINKLDNQDALLLAEKVIKEINRKNANYISKIIIGSLKYGKYYN